MGAYIVCMYIRAKHFFSFSFQVRPEEDPMGLCACGDFIHKTTQGALCNSHAPAEPFPASVELRA